MLTIPQSIAFLLAAVTGSLLFMWLLNRLWPPDRRRIHNDQIGWQLTALGTTYAVILGFMLYAVWTNFGEADLNVDHEADALVNIFRLADGLPAEQRAKMRELTRAYAVAMVEREWPVMEQGKVPNESQDLNGEMWRTLMSMHDDSPNQLMAQDHALYELSELTQHRRTRMVQSAARLPLVLWCLLLIGGVLTVASACLFGSANSILHGLQVLAFSLLITVALVAIGEINRPFQGAIRVTDFAFRRALDNMQP